MKKWLALAVALVVACSAFAQDAPGAKDFLAGQEAMKTNNFDAAIPALEKAVSANPDLFAGYYYLGFAYRAKKTWDKSADNFSKFLAKAGNDPKAAEMVGHATREGGLAYARASEPAKAVPLLEKAVSSKPNDKEAQYFLAIALMQTKREAQAEPVFAKVIQLDAALPRPYYYAGRINFNRQEWEKAYERLNKFLELKPDDSFAPDAHFMVGSIAVRNAEGSSDPAAAASAVMHLEAFLAAKPNAPQSPQAHYILGSLAAQAEDNAKAKMHFEAYIQLEPNGAQAEEVKKFLADLSAAGP